MKLRSYKLHKNLCRSFPSATQSAPILESNHSKQKPLTSTSKVPLLASSRKVRKAKLKLKSTELIKREFPVISREKRIVGHRRDIIQNRKIRALNNEELEYKWLYLTNQHNIVAQTHPLFREESLKLFHHPMIKNIHMKDIKIDNDWETDDEQIDHTIKYLNKKLIDGIIEFGVNQDKVYNYKKYGKSIISKG